MSVSTEDFNYLRVLIKEKSGINLTEDKVYLIESRLLPLARKHDIQDIAALVLTIKTGGNNSQLETEIIESMTTNETSFYRDLKPFQQFDNDVLPHILEHNKTNDVKIWCCASSTGQEPYSLAMSIKEQAHKTQGKNFTINATDIDTKIITKAQEGIYSQFEVQRGLPITLLMKYFHQQERYGDKWKLNPEITDMVKFKYLNLLDSYTSMGQYDAIFCRNVLIYFDAETKADIVNRLAKCLKPHGVLFLGSTESINDTDGNYEIFNKIRSIHQLRQEG